MPGYNETEKIKILYEESLKDICDVVSRIEAVGTALGEVAAKQEARDTSSNTQNAMQDIIGDVDVLGMGRVVIATTIFGIVMVAIGAFIGGNRENWGISGVVATGVAFGMIAGIGIGYFAKVKIEEARKRKAYWDDPKRKQWRKDLEKKCQEG